jgi:HTH-type transcriptional regulator, osmoprotectant uptake regulator
MVKTARDDFIDLIVENVKVNGLDDLSSNIIANLYVSPEEVSLEELSKKTGYSLSSVSTSLKMIERFGFVSRMKKPRSRKVYFYMEKDLMTMGMRLMKRKYEKVILPSKRRLPVIIEKYKKYKSKTSKQEADIAKNYYKQVTASQGMMKKIIKMIEVIHKISGK